MDSTLKRIGICSALVFSTMIAPVYGSETITATPVFIRFENGQPVEYSSATTLGQMNCALGGWEFDRIEPWEDQFGIFNVVCTDENDNEYTSAFSASPKCPDDTTHIGNNECRIDAARETSMSGEPECSAHNPVNLLTGKKYQREVDVAVTKSPLARLVRHYNGATGWQLGYQRRVGYQSWYGDPNTQTLYYIDEDGTTHIIHGFNLQSNTRGLRASLTLGTDGEFAGKPETFTITKPDGTIEHFDGNGHPQSIHHPSGDSLTFHSVVEQGTLKHSITSNRGDLIVFGDAVLPQTNWYYEQPRYFDITVNGNRIQYEYNDDWLVTKVIYPDNTTRRYQYTSSGQLSGIIDENGHPEATWQYDDQDRVIRGSHADETNVFTFHYSHFDLDSNQGSVRVTNPLGRESVYRFTRVGSRRHISAVEGQASPNCPAYSRASSYDSSGHVLSTTDRQGNRTQYTRDALHREISRTEAAGTEVERTITTQWDETHHQVRSRQYPLHSESLGYDAAGRVIRITRTDPASGEARITALTRDSEGRIVRIDGPRTDVEDLTEIGYHDCTVAANCAQIATVKNALGQVSSIPHYNASGQPTSMVDANGVTTTLSYDARQRLTAMSRAGQTTQYEYDDVGNLLNTTFADGVSVANRYDPANRLIAVQDSLGNRIEWTLDAAGNRTVEQFKDPSGALRKTQQRAYDEINRLIRLTGAHGASEHYQYDGNHNRIRTTDAAGRITLRGVDALDRLVSLQDALQGITRLSYDARDNITAVTDPEGQTTRFSYNGFGDMLREDSPDRGTIHYSYDAAGNRLSRTDARGLTTTYRYDALNRLTAEHFADSAQDITYTYDQGTHGVGRLTRIDDHSGSTVFSYDARGNITQISQTIGGQTYTTAYAYNAADRLIGLTYPSGRTVHYDYDAGGRVARVSSHFNGVSETLADAVNHLPFGPIASVTLGNGVQRRRDYDQDYRIQDLTDAAVLSRHYAHNTVDHITAITDTLSPASSQLFDYDVLDRLAFAGGDYGDQSFSYDGVGNRLSRALEHGGQTLTETYHYGTADHRLDAIPGKASYRYDAAGNTLSDGTRDFTYHSRNRMGSSTTAGATTHYRYNALGQRVSKSHANGTVHYLYDRDGRLITEAKDDDTIAVEYAYLNGEPLAQWRESAPPVPGSVTPIAPQGEVATASPTFEWHRVDHADEYQLSVRDNARGEQVHRRRYRADDLCTADLCRVTPALSLNFANNHRWKVRGINTHGAGPWSEPVRFDYRDQPPQAITPQAPIGTADSATPSYRWQDLGNAELYQLKVFDRYLQALVHDEQHAATEICTSEACAVMPAGLSLNFHKNHYWKVRAKNTGGWGPWTDKILFNYLDDPPSAPTAEAPIGAVTTATPAYRWQDVGNAELYQLKVFDRHLQILVHDEQHAATAICTHGSCMIQPPGLNLSLHNNHYWKVRGKNTGGWGEWTSKQRFDVTAGQ